MHRLDEASIIDSMRRVYYRRICEVLGESETRDKRRSAAATAECVEDRTGINLFLCRDQRATKS